MDNKYTLENFKKQVINAEEIIQDNNLDNDNIETFIHEKITYVLSNKHPNFLIKGINIDTMYTPIDYAMVDIITMLNNNGYYTDWCCEGKINGSGYIAFTNNLNGKIISIKKIIEIYCILDNHIIPNIKCESKIDIDTPQLIFRWYPKTDEEKTQVLTVLKENINKFLNK